MIDRLQEARLFAKEAHKDQKRKMSNEPYYSHLIEVSEILMTLTDDEDTVIAGLLHDVLEDTERTAEDIENSFGSRVLSLVMAETEDVSNKDKSSENWIYRKRKSLEELERVEDIEAKKLWLADKLSNMRSFRREYDKQGISFISALHQKDPALHSWYYRKILEYIAEFEDTDAYRELKEHIEYIFGDIEPWEEN